MGGCQAGTDQGGAPLGMRVGWVDPADVQAFEAWFATMDEAARHGRADPLVWERQDLRTHLLDDDEDEVHLIAAAHLDDRVVAAGSIDVPLRENLDSAALDVNVAPARRRAGVGSALLRFLEDEATARGRTRLEGEAVVVGAGPPEASPGVAFARHHGFRVANTEDHLVLDLPEGVPGPAEVPAGHTLVDWRDRAPSEFATAYAEMRAALGGDVPRGGLAREPEVWDLERLRASEQRSRNQGRTTLVSAAVAADGSVVGHTTMTVPEGDGPAVHQGDTYVMTAHRGHGLGRVLKERNLATLAALRAGRPTTIHTWTADVNAPMTAVNRALGFRTAEVTCEVERAGRTAAD